jgi:predicted transcriptional regulator
MQLMDDQTSTTPKTQLMEMTTDIVSSFVSKNKMAVAELSVLISQVHAALIAAGKGKSEAEPVKREPAVPIKSSVKPDYIICLEDGKTFKSLKRHLRTAYNMTPDEYRKKWDLNYDYPMVAPTYAAKRSELGEDHGSWQYAAEDGEGRQGACQECSDEKGWSKEGGLKEVRRGSGYPRDPRCSGSARC